MMRPSMARRLKVQAPQWMIRSYLPGSSGKSCPCMCSNSSLPPTYCVSQRGIFTRQMSSAMGWWLQALERLPELAFLDHEGHGVGVHEVADGLHLRQDEATSRGLLVDGHHQDGHLAGAHEVAHEGRGVDEVRRSRV